MIFVTVGTHEQQFDRLISAVDNLKEQEIIKEDVLIQTGFSTYLPKYCQWCKLIPYNEMNENIKNARIVITHGGPASFIAPIQLGKIPVVVPRQRQFNEHVNNHQLEFVKIVEKRMANIIPVYDIQKLGDILTHYEETAASLSSKMNSNNAEFNKELENIVSRMFSEK